MRAIKQTIFFLFLLTAISSVMTGSASISKGFDIKKKFTSSGDTSLVNKYSRLALKYVSKQPDQKYNNSGKPQATDESTFYFQYP